MEIVSKISRGTKMDQVYLPKNRHGFSIGTYVLITPLREPKETERSYFYNASIEPLKVQIIQEIFFLIERSSNSYENIIITGSFLEKGFCFNDIDILLISEEKEETAVIAQEIEEQFGSKAQILVLRNKELLKGLSTDPLYEMMLSCCVAKKRFIYKTEREIHYKQLDLQLLKSKTLLDTFDLLDGNEKWYLVRNLVCIALFLEHKKITHDTVENEVKHVFGVSPQELKRNVFEKHYFLKKYRSYYQKTFMLIMTSIKHAKQKQAS